MRKISDNETNFFHFFNSYSTTDAKISMFVFIEKVEDKDATHFFLYLNHFFWYRFLPEINFEKLLNSSSDLIKICSLLFMTLTIDWSSQRLFTLDDRQSTNGNVLI